MGLAAEILHRPALLGYGDEQRLQHESGLGHQQQARPPAVARRGPAGPAAPQEGTPDRTAVGAMSPNRPNLIRAMDFRFGTTAGGRTITMLNVIDGFAREALAIHVDRAINADGVVHILDQLVETHGAPYVRIDNGPALVAHADNDWCRFNGTGSLFIDPGLPWQNAWIESFHARLCDELLDSLRFDSPLRAG